MIGLVQRWAELGEPTSRGLAIQAVSLVHLCLVDRAWIRLESVKREDKVDHDLMFAVAEAFLAHGWPTRAKWALDRLANEPLDAHRANRVRALQGALTADPPPSPDETTEGDGYRAAIKLAERYIATGAYLKAQRILEKLRRERPQGERVADLLWALEGEFGLVDHDLHDIVDRVLDLGAAEQTEEVEHTESVRRADFVPPPPEPDVGLSFPTLFRRDEALPSQPDRTTQPEEESSEVTQSSSMATLEALAAAAITVGDDDAGDTQIARIIRTERGPELGAAKGQLHARLPEDSGAFDLRSFRREMGMNSQPDMDVAPLSPMELEDDSRVILMRRPKSVSDAIDEAAPHGVETIEPDTTSSIRRGMAEEIRLSTSEAPTSPDLAPPKPVASPAAPSAAPSTAPADESRPGSPPAAKKRRKMPSATPIWLLMLGMVLLFAAGLLFLALVFRLFQLYG